MEEKPKNSSIPISVGGQALIEGVMIRTPKCVAMAVRKPNGTITVKKHPFISMSKRFKLLGLPVIRGIVNVFEMMVLGLRGINFSAEESLDEESETAQTESGKTPQWMITLSFIFSFCLSIVFAVFLFKFVPLYLAQAIKNAFPQIGDSIILFNIIDGLIRIAIFFTYIGILSRIKTFQRIFEYHGAEHKSIFAYEKGLALIPNSVKPESPRHPRCGTSFIILVLIVSIILLSLVPKDPNFFLYFGKRLAMIPLIMGVGYEILKFSARWQGSRFLHWMTVPGIWTQYLTTKEPDEGQIEVALAALKAALEIEEIPPPTSLGSGTDFGVHIQIKPEN